jgi:hypothetical protein
MLFNIDERYSYKHQQHIDFICSEFPNNDLRVQHLYHCIINKQH